MQRTLGTIRGELSVRIRTMISNGELRQSFFAQSVNGQGKGHINQQFAGPGGETCTKEEVAELEGLWTLN